MTNVAKKKILAKNREKNQRLLKLFFPKVFQSE